MNYEITTPIASMSITNCIALVIWNVEYGIENKVEVGYIVDGEKKKTHKLKVYSTLKGNSYFRLDGRRYDMSLFMRL